MTKNSLVYLLFFVTEYLSHKNTHDILCLLCLDTLQTKFFYFINKLKEVYKHTR